MMLTRAQINKAINDNIIAEFPTVPIQSIDVEEGFQRPSFFVTLETRNTESFLTNALREMTCQILFFPSDRNKYKEEAYDVQDKLEILFGLNFAVGDRVITIDGAFTDIVDKVVHYNFDFSYYEDVQQPESGELMQELKFNE
ncbi:hypothetical protein P9314_04015 [Paenibacillus validus]|uniref:phage tail terminator family protein n=1 Tax=Paenibacillus validus TaxID=44253 RepID=UPI000FD8B3B9|nr:hypothetical protein [Paenibacillus validus]MED4599873.1 hypothetical protein [Paenibacillus validus]MED4606094.1 hypothetical protein [Paenibacillus validus]